LKKPSTIYTGQRTSAGVPLVIVDGALLTPARSQAVRDFSAVFGWGLFFGPASQLALAILLDYVGDADLAIALMPAFRFHYVSQWGDDWRITGEQLHAFVFDGERGRSVRGMERPAVERAVVPVIA
jgi:hypothetical protein